jgi:pimeloyl-ACP methyl ester carboxylesterase
MNRGMTAFALAGVAGTASYVAVRRRTGPQPVQQPPGDYCDIDGERIHYIEEGSGPAVLLIHGFLGSTFTWRTVVPALAPAHRVIAMDLAGFGYSDRSPGLDFSLEGQAKRAARLLDALGVGSAAVVGHSLGGGVAEWLAATAPQRVSHLVLVAAVDASVHDRWQQDTRARELQLRLAAAAFRSPWLLRKAARRAIARMATPEFATPDVVDAYVAPLLLPGTLDCIRALARALDTSTLVDPSAITAPTLVISGDHDVDVRPEVGEGLAASIRGARHAIIPSGHLIPDEHPDLLVAELEAFLAQLAPAAGA